MSSVPDSSVLRELIITDIRPDFTMSAYDTKRTIPTCADRSATDPKQTCSHASRGIIFSD